MPSLLLENREVETTLWKWRQWSLWTEKFWFLRLGKRNSNCVMNWFGFHNWTCFTLWDGISCSIMQYCAILCHNMLHFTLCHVMFHFTGFIVSHFATAHSSLFLTFFFPNLIKIRQIFVILRSETLQRFDVWETIQWFNGLQVGASHPAPTLPVRWGFSKRVKRRRLMKKDCLIVKKKGSTGKEPDDVRTWGIIFQI